MTKITKKQAIEKINDLISSCNGGREEEWNLFYDENWDCMITHLKEIKEYIK